MRNFNPIVATKTVNKKKNLKRLIKPGVEIVLPKFQVSTDSCQQLRNLLRKQRLKRQSENDGFVYVSLSDVCGFLKISNFSTAVAKNQ